jgi:hypothetical protein
MPRKVFKATHIRQVFTEHTGGDMMVDFIELSNGVVLSITPEAVLAFRDADEVGVNAFAEMTIEKRKEGGGK